jgi:glycosyltransferase involved in cell wall biosynthesis
VRILFLLTQDLESPSGVGRYLPLARELALRGHQVSIAALHSNFESLPNRHYNHNGVDIHYVAPMHVRKQGDQKSYYSTGKLLLIAIKATWQLILAVIKIPTDIIHIGKPHPMNGIAGLVAKYLLGRQVYLDCDDYEAASSRFQAEWQRKVIAFFENWLPHRVDFLTTNTYFTKDRLIKIGIPEERIFYLPNGVDRARFAQSDPSKIEALRKEMDLQGKKVIAYIGSLSLVNHPVDLLLKAFLSVRQAQSNSVLLVVGGGEDYQQLKEQAKELKIGDSVIFYGHVLADQVPLFYRLADVSVEPVNDDDAARGRSPLKLFESWACGVPFITSDVGDRGSLIGNPLAALLVKPSDSASLAEAILTLLTKPEEALRLRQYGLERVKEYNWKELAAQLEAFNIDKFSKGRSS